MTTTLSSRGQIVLPKQTRARLHLRPGTKFSCKIEGDSIVLTPENRVVGKNKSVKDKSTGLIVTKTPPEVKVTLDQVRAAMADFP